MTDPKNKQPNSLRVPKPKKKLGLTVPKPLRMPHEELVRPADPQEHKEQSTMPSQTRQISPINQSTQHPVSPTRDFTKVANSIAREAIPAGIFKGKSKQLYDYLYTVTRGAIVPTRTVRMSRPKLMAAAGIGSRVTFDANIERLCAVGLIDVRTIAGEHEGNEYTVYLPEEISTTMPSLTSLTSLTGYAQKLVRLVRLETSQTRHTSNAEESTSSTLPKTSFKTIDDDDGVNSFWRVLSAAAREVLGGDLPRTDQERERWQECASVLADELTRAAERAGNVSSVPAFFAAHLRRRFKTGQAAKGEPGPDPQLTKSQVTSLTIEQKLLKMIKELRALHVGDPDYKESDLVDDIKFRCERNGITVDEESILKLLNPGQKIE